MTKYVLALTLCLCSYLSYAQMPVAIKESSSTIHGPEKGSLIIIGGNVGRTPAIWEKFVELAGGKKNAKIVVITAAAGEEAALDMKSVDEVKDITGIKDVKLLHAKSIVEANSAEFIKSINEATGVYFIGGRQWHIADHYLNTLTHQAFLDLLDRGGVIAGSSAGASIQGSFLWRGDTSGSDVLIGDHTQGLGFLKNSVIDQHVLRRNRQFDLIGVVKQAPKLIGIGMDEATAVLVQRDTMEVLGKSYVAVYDYNTIIKESEKPFVFLSEGQKYDLRNRKVIVPEGRGRQAEDDK